MAAPGKVLDNMTKHLTLAETAARAEAEGELLTHVELSPDKPPALLKGDAAARRYWAAILGRMDNVLLLDSLDTEVMAIYCTMLSRRDRLQKASRAKNLEPKDAAAISTEPSDGSGLDSASDTPRGAQASDVAKEAVPQGLRTPPARQIISGGKSSSKDPEAIFDEDESIWWQYGPMPANVSGIILETKSGACIRVLNPDADLSKRWIWVPGST